MVVIAESTRKLLGNLFDLQDLGAKEIKGIAEPVRAWAALRPSSVESRFEALRTATTPLVGREEELELLLRRWEQAKTRRRPGGAAFGRSRVSASRASPQTIVETACRRAAHPPALFCSPHHQDSALYPVIGQLERAAGFRRDDTAEQRLDKLEALLAQATNDLGEVAPLFADLLVDPTGDRYPPLNLTPQKRKEKTLTALTAQVEGLSRARARADGVRGRALERPDHARVARPAGRSGASTSRAGDHHFPAGVHAAVDRPPPCDDAHAQSPAAAASVPR